MSKTFFDELHKRIAKNVKGVHHSIMSQSDIATITDWIKTPSLDLNRILSGDVHKGIPNRALVGIVGPEHTMKSSFMIICMAEAQKQGYLPVIIDTERGVDTEFSKRWGLDVDNAQYSYTPWTQEIKAILAQIKDTGQKKLIIGIDSAGGIDRYKSYTDSLGGDLKADQGLLQKELRSILRLFLNICIEQESIGIVTGHLYGSPSPVPMPDQVGGGKAMRLFPTILINLKKEHIKNSKKEIIGTKITATTLKNRVYPPYQVAAVDIDYRKGINPYAGLIDVLEEAGIVKLDGNTYYTKEDIKLGVSYDKATAAISEHPELLDDLNVWLKTTGYSSTDNAVKEMEEMIVPDDEEDEVEEPRTNGKRNNGKKNGKKKR